MLSINKEMLKVAKNKKIYKILIDFINDKNINICILLNKKIAINDFQNYLSELLGKDIDISCIVYKNNKSKEYLLLNHYEKFNNLSYQRFIFVLVPINKNFLKDEYTFIIDDLPQKNDLLQTDDLLQLDNKFNRNNYTWFPPPVTSPFINIPSEQGSYNDNRRSNLYYTDYTEYNPR